MTFMFLSFFFLSFCLMLGFLFFLVLSSASAWGLSFCLFSFGGVDLVFSLALDYVSLSFFSAVSFISGSVYFFSVYYMAGTVDLRRFSWLVFGFVFSMGVLVFSGNFFTLMVGWDGLGLTSFCLVIFYGNYSSLESGLLTVFSNRVGDVFFLGCFFLLFLTGFGLGEAFESHSFLGLFFLFLGAITKSAQFPFSAWLPAAMAAPTPVSSLVHSSTLVTAGVYVLLRFHYFFFFFNIVFFKTFFLLTMILAGLCANLELDFKKIVAMSTLSQLGFMLFVLSCGAWLLAFMHLLIHALFKSLLFMSTGSLMAGLGGGQDSRFFGGNFFSFFSFGCFFVSCLCLMGFPFFIGFYSKDLVLSSGGSSFGIIFYLSFIGGCLLTILYSFRLLCASFKGNFHVYSYSSFLGDFMFMGSVFFLFLKTWWLGSFFSSVFFAEGGIFFSVVDLVWGLLLIFLGLFLGKIIFHFYHSLVSFFLIGYLRGLSSSGVSSGFKDFSMPRWDLSWLELGGGQGAYLFLKSCWSYDWYKAMGLGLLFLFFLLWLCV